MSLLRHAKNKARQIVDRLNMPELAKAELALDRRGLPEVDPGIERIVQAGVAWLKRAQDQSTSHDGGVARDFSLLKGWAESYPETTGYIIPTMLDCARRFDDVDARERAKRMLDWFVAIQFPEGGFQGGKINAKPRVPVTFNTGQILLGLAAGAAEFGEPYLGAMHKAAQWLADSLDDDGCWRKHPTPFAEAGEKTYETHVAWSLLEADRVAPGKGYGQAGLKQVRWAIGNQHANGWLSHCCLNMPDVPLTHTLGYALRGFVEAYRFSKDEFFLQAALKTADGLLLTQRQDGSLPGRLTAEWQPAADWVCLTGCVQIAHSWLMLFEYTGNTAYRNAAEMANRYVRRTIHVTGSADTLGGVKGAFPVDGGYGEFEFLNWSVKFSIDSNLLELDLRQRHA